MERGVTFPTLACSVRPITMHCASWPIRPDCACRKEAGHRGPTIMYSIWKIMCFLNIKACQHILLHQIHQIIIFKKASYDPFKNLADGFIKDWLSKCIMHLMHSLGTKPMTLALLYCLSYSTARNSTLDFHPHSVVSSDFMALSIMNVGRTIVGLTRKCTLFCNLDISFHCMTEM